MLRRTLKADFAGGMYVFPGGAVDDADRSPTTSRPGATASPTARRAASSRSADRRAGVLDRRHPGVLRGGRRPAGPPAGRCVRPLRRPDGRGALPGPPRGGRTTARCGWSTCAPTRACAWPPTTSTTSATGSRRSASRRRFDTRFFVARAPQAQEPLHDDHETIASLWVRPADALGPARAGRAGDDRPDDRRTSSCWSPTPRPTRSLAATASLGRPPAIHPSCASTTTAGWRSCMPADPDFADLPELDRPRR